MSKSETIARLNDLLRTTMSSKHGRVMLTAGVAELPIGTQLAVLTAIRTFKDWNGDNDPHKERDFCAVDVQGERFFAKIDYYDPSMQYGSDDPSDPLKT